MNDQIGQIRIKNINKDLMYRSFVNRSIPQLLKEQEGIYHNDIPYS